MNINIKEEEEEEEEEDVIVEIAPVLTTNRTFNNSERQPSAQKRLSPKKNLQLQGKNTYVREGLADRDAIYSVGGHPLKPLFDGRVLPGKNTIPGTGPNGKLTAFDYDIDNMEERNWEKPGADVADYFNYGFNPETWKEYGLKQLRIRAEKLDNRNKIAVFDSNLPLNGQQSFNITPQVARIPVGGVPSFHIHAPAFPTEKKTILPNYQQGGQFTQHHHMPHYHQPRVYQQNVNMNAAMNMNVVTENNVPMGGFNKNVPQVQQTTENVDLNRDEGKYKVKEEEREGRSRDKEKGRSREKDDEDDDDDDDDDDRRRERERSRSRSESRDRRRRRSRRSDSRERSRDRRSRRSDSRSRSRSRSRERSSRREEITKVASKNVNEIDMSQYRIHKNEKTQLTLYSHKFLHGKPTWKHPLETYKPLWYRRVAATLIDIGVSVGSAFVCQFTILYELENFQLASFGAMAGFSAVLVFRDILFESGTRSFGKKIMKLEIVNEKDGSLPYRVKNTLRNFNGGSLNSLGMLLFPLLHISFIMDVMPMFLRSDGRRLSDLACGTIVVNELPLRKERLEARQRKEDKDELDDTLRSNLPKESFSNNLTWSYIRKRHRMFGYNFRGNRKKYAKGNSV